MKIVENNILGRRIRVNSKSVDPRTLDLKTYPPIETIYRQRDRERRKVLAAESKSTFDIKANGTGDDSCLIPKAELLADELLTYRGVIICTSDSKVIYGHEIVRKALLSNDPSVSASFYLEPVSTAEVHASAMRHSTKEGRLGTMSRLESIVIAVNDHGITFPQLTLLLTGPRAKDSPKQEDDIKKEYITGRWYQKYGGGLKLNALGDELTDDTFSRLKMMAGNKTILKDSQRSEELEAHFIHSAVMATIRGMPRFEKDLRKIVRHEDTYETFKTKGLNPALAELQAKYPEDSKESHPHYDFVAAEKKLRDKTISTSISHFAKRGLSPSETAFHELLIRWSELCPELHKRLLKLLVQREPELYLEVGITERPDLMPEILEAAQSQYTKIANSMNGRS